MRKGKIKFSHTSAGQKIGTKTDYFRVCQDAKNKAGDWENYIGFEPQLRELKFRFPFTKIGNNIKIGYSGFCQLPIDGTARGELGSYFVVSEGIGCPLIARPDGHSGILYDGRDEKKSLLLTEERLAKWKMVKKRMSVFISPEGWGPHEWIVWSTTSEVAMDMLQTEYTQLERLLGNNLCLVPLTLRAVTKQFKNKEGKNTRFALGSIGFSGSPKELMDNTNEANNLKNFFNIKALEEDFERSSFFFEEDEDESQVVAKEVINPETGEVTHLNSKDEEIAPRHGFDLAETIQGLVGDTQVRTIVQLAKKLNREAEILQCNSPAKALALLNSLVSEDNRARQKIAA